MAVQLSHLLVQWGEPFHTRWYIWQHSCDHSSTCTLTHTHTHYSGNKLHNTHTSTPTLGSSWEGQGQEGTGHFLLESGRKISMSGVAACCCCCCCCCCFMAARFSASILLRASSRALAAERIFSACSGEESGVSLLFAFSPLLLDPVK